MTCRKNNLKNIGEMKKLTRANPNAASLTQAFWETCGGTVVSEKTIKLKELYYDKADILPGSHYFLKLSGRRSIS